MVPDSEWTLNSAQHFHQRRDILAMAIDLLVFQHTQWEGPGRYLLECAKKNNIRLHIIGLWRQPLPEVDDYDGLLVLGGAPNVAQETQYPFLVQEKQAIKQILRADKPYLGFCLGHQLLADSLGAEVGPNFKASVGFVQGYLTRAGRQHPVFENFPVRQILYKWHGQAVREPVPRQVEILSISADCQVEAISVADHPHIVGIQADSHAAAPEDIAVWLEKDAKWLASLGGSSPAPETILVQAREYADQTRSDFAHFFSNWLQFFN
jgi:GMP synthase (glutamine-hydrolysing)